MAKFVPPPLSLRIVWLGQQLKKLRDENKMTLKQAGAYLQRDGSTVSRFESGEYPIRRPDLTLLLDLYKVSDPDRREGFFKLCEEAWKSGWWDGHAETAASTLIDLAWVEDRAEKIEYYESVLLPGMLQTPEYAKTVMRIGDPEAAGAQIEAWMRLRTARQQILLRDNPPYIRAVLDESVLRRSLGAPEVRRGQLSHLVTLAARPNIEIRVLSYDAAVHASTTGKFVLFTLPEPYPQAAYVETLAGNIFVESEKAELIRQTYHRLMKAALRPEQSVELIKKLAEETP